MTIAVESAAGVLPPSLAQELATKVTEHQRSRLAIMPDQARPNCLVVDLSGGARDARSFVRSLKEAISAVGLRSYLGDCSFGLAGKGLASITTEQVVRQMEMWQDSYSPDAIVLALPLAEHLRADEIFAALPAAKDVECLSEFHRARIAFGNMVVFPPAAMAVVCYLDGLRRASPEQWASAKRVLIVGKGKVAHNLSGLMSRQSVVDASVLHPDFGCIAPRDGHTLVWVQPDSSDLWSELQLADVVVSLSRRPALIDWQWLKAGAIAISLGGCYVDNVWRSDIQQVTSDHLRVRVVHDLGRLTAAITVANCIK